VHRATIHGEADTHFGFAGTLDATDAVSTPGSNYTSSQNGMLPRTNIAAPASYGMIFVENTGGAGSSIVVSLRFKAVYAVVVHPDDPTRVVSPVVTAARPTLPSLQTHQPLEKSLSLTVRSKGSEGHVDALADAHRRNGVPPNVANRAAGDQADTATPVAKPSFTHQVSEALSDASVAFYNMKKSGLWAEAKSAASSVYNWVASFARSAPVREAEMIGARAAPLLLAA